MPPTLLLFAILSIPVTGFPADPELAYPSLPSITEKMEQVLNEKGLAEALKTYEELRNEKESRYDFSFNQLHGLGHTLLKQGRSDEALAVLKLNSRFFPENPAGYRALAEAHLQIGDRGKSLEYINLAMDADPLSLPTIILRKRLLLVPEDFTVPETLETEAFRLKPLTSAYVDLDYEAVMSSKDHLQGVLGRPDWPGDLTREEDLGALQMHEKEFNQRIGFVYTVLNHQETECLGCVYIYPSRLDEYDAEVIMWVSLDSFEKGLDPLLFKTIKAWLAESWPFDKVIYTGRDIEWGEFFDLLAEQDQKYH